jgi:hypothetical protein
MATNGIKSNKVSSLDTHDAVASVFVLINAWEHVTFHSSSFKVRGLWAQGQELDISAEHEISCFGQLHITIPSQVVTHE